MNSVQSTSALDVSLMDRAARRGLRGHGHVEPNPMVGCVGVDRDGRVVAESHHRTLGGPHAERLLLQEHGSSLRGGTIYTTLEPCTHQGRTPACTDAILEAGLSRVVVGCLDPNPEASGGVELLREAGLEVTVLQHSPSHELSAIFRHRVTSGLPWVVAKWAQTLDGRLATRQGHSQWISGPRSRRLVHRQRGRVDAILTGIGTVLADDPRLTCRDVRARRVARRVVVDPDLRMPADAALLKTLDVAPLTIACSEQSMTAQSARTKELIGAGVDVLALRRTGDAGLALTDLLIHLSAVHNCSTVMTESGPGLLGSMLRSGLVNEAMVFVAPTVLGDEEAVSAINGFSPATIDEGIGLSLRSMHRRDDDVLLRYGVSSGGAASP
ncbi:MAG: bifunctional diaminohydroxyphosphoribosylaminopyrimidine deaminase/5-amino-6-(5-phosphoribosylamino)uracil reductase RibD [Phycisphaerales bacterium]|nr:bifunctional diaminohydroxyphosphoribosylaminopyrimidine deaminase/5-amino-6-(5-phosphoribosylamino)uracil reductase RibD [Phycisphaerales bacterium]